MAETPKRRVVLAMDGSEYADYAFNWYVENFKMDGDYLTVVHSFEAKSISHAALGSDVKALGNVLEEEAKENKAILELLRNKLASAGRGLGLQQEGETTTNFDRFGYKEFKRDGYRTQVAGEVKPLVGKPGETVVHEAHEQNADVILCGSRGHGKLRRTFMGSVSDYIVHHSHVPVVVCRHKNHHHGHGHHH